MCLLNLFCVCVCVWEGGMGVCVCMYVGVFGMRACVRVCVIIYIFKFIFTVPYKF